MYDLVIKNGNIIDGTGSPAYISNIGIRDGKILRIGPDVTRGAEEIDARGLAVTPGFIDSHTHADDNLLLYPEQIEKVEQGITGGVAGNCGLSVTPVSSDHKPYPVGDLGSSQEIYKTFGSFMDAARKTPLGSGFACFLGHCALRKLVVGQEDREATREELERMGQILEEAIAHGALGISFGMTYIPGCFARPEEAEYLAGVAARCGAMVSSHIRDEGYDLENACQEFIQMIRRSGARGVISHHKAMYKDNWGKVKRTLEMIDEANAQGCDIYCDVYPYTASKTALYARFIPKDYYSGGTAALVKNLQDPAIREKVRQANMEKFGQDDLSWCLITSCKSFPEYAGLRINELAARQGKDVYDTVFDLIVQSNNNCQACFFLMCEEDLETVLAHPRSMICTDSSVRGNHNVYHPRLRGSFPRALGRYVRERGVVSLPEMIRKMTGMPAEVYGFTGKGLLQEGYDADICIFDPETIRDRCDYLDCHKRAEGLCYVLVNGKIAVKDGIYNGTRAATVLK